MLKYPKVQVGAVAVIVAEKTMVEEGIEIMTVEVVVKDVIEVLHKVVLTILEKEEAKKVEAIFFKGLTNAF